MKLWITNTMVAFEQEQSTLMYCCLFTPRQASMVTRAVITALGRWGQLEQEFKANLSHISNLCPAWATRDPISNKK